MKKILLFLTVYVSIFSVYSQTPQQYISFEGTTLSLYAWQGNKIMLLSNSDTLNQTTMNNWTHTLDTAYNYYAFCTGREPSFYSNTYINNRSTIAEVPSTCGAGCGYLGFTGIEILSPYFMTMYSYIDEQNLYDQTPFYELGRNFWFYDNKLSYKTNDPIATGYAVFMRFMAMEAAGVQGAPFNVWSFSKFKTNVMNLLFFYMADSSYNWSNTLAVDQGIPNTYLGATDLFASFCFYLRNNYNSNQWVENIWKFAGLRANAATTQAAVDNFIIASSQAANTNLVPLFLYWKWPVSASAITYLNSYDFGIINSQPFNKTVNLGSDAQFSISSSQASADFQWQIDTGYGFQNVNNAGQFSGALTNNLIVSNATFSNNFSEFRCIVTFGAIIDTSITVTLRVFAPNLGLISSHPESVTITSGGNAQFSISSYVSNVDYHWQCDAYGSFVNFYDNGDSTAGGQFSGTLTSNMTIFRVNLSNNNYHLRCIVSFGPYIDTSEIVTLHVINPTEIPENEVKRIFSVYPNPSNGNFFVIQSLNEAMNGLSQISIRNILGEEIFSGKLKSAQTEIDLSNATKGVYFYQIQNGRKVIRTGEIIIE